MIVAAAPDVHADGEFLQVDISESTRSAVAAINRGAFSFGASHVRFDGGAQTVLNALYALPVPDTAPTFRLGPSLGHIAQDDAPSETEAGVKLAVEKWMPTDFGSLFLLGEANTIEASVFAVGQLAFSGPGLTLELSHGRSDTYSETTLAVSKRIGAAPVSLRGGYRFDAEEVFVGLAVNTF